MPTLGSSPLEHPFADGPSELMTSLRLLYRKERPGHDTCVQATVAWLAASMIDIRVSAEHQAFAVPVEDFLRGVLPRQTVMGPIPSRFSAVDTRMIPSGTAVPSQASVHLLVTFHRFATSLAGFRSLFDPRWITVYLGDLASAFLVKWTPLVGFRRFSTPFFSAVLTAYSLCRKPLEVCPVLVSVQEGEKLFRLGSMTAAGAVGWTFPMKVAGTSWLAFLFRHVTNNNMPLRRWPL